MSLRGRPDIVIVDLREKSERERRGTIPGSLHAPYTDLRENIGGGGMLHELAQATGKQIVFCAYDERSAMAVQAAQEAGLNTSVHVQGGIDAWKKASGPLSWSTKVRTELSAARRVVAVKGRSWRLDDIPSANRPPISENKARSDGVGLLSILQAGDRYGAGSTGLPHCRIFTESIERERVRFVSFSLDF